LKEADKIAFELLKKHISETFLGENPAPTADISQWKGDTIVRFQEDLLHKVKGRVSEKWFYNYFRNDIQKLPRIDMLNLLSEYVGYKNWADFLHQNRKKIKPVQGKSNTRMYLMLLVAGLLFSVVYILAGIFQSNKAVFCFVDEAGNPVSNIQVIQLIDKQSDKVLNLKDNCVELMETGKQVRLKIVSPYYKDLVIVRDIDTQTDKEILVLQPDLYALLLKTYSSTNTDNWAKRRRQLGTIISDKALIYQQWFGQNQGIEIYDKPEFIGQLCLPTGWVRNIEILEIEQQNNKIVKLGFTLKNKKK